MVGIHGTLIQSRDTSSSGIRRCAVFCRLHGKRRRQSCGARQPRPHDHLASVRAHGGHYERFGQGAGESDEPARVVGAGEGGFHHGADEWAEADVKD